MCLFCFLSSFFNYNCRSQPIGDQFYDNFATAGVPIVCVTANESSYYHGDDDSDGEDQHILPVRS